MKQDGISPIRFLSYIESKKSLLSQYRSPHFQIHNQKPNEGKSQILLPSFRNILQLIQRKQWKHDCSMQAKMIT